MQVVSGTHSAPCLQATVDTHRAGKLLHCEKSKNQRANQLQLKDAIIVCTARRFPAVFKRMKYVMD